MGIISAEHETPSQAIDVDSQEADTVAVAEVAQISPLVGWHCAQDRHLLRQYLLIQTIGRDGEVPEFQGRQPVTST